MLKSTSFSPSLSRDMAQEAKNSANSAGLNPSADKVDEQAEREQIRKVSQDFSSFFYRLMMQSLRQTVQEGHMEASSGEKMFRTLLDEEYATVLSKQESNPLAKMIEDSLLTMRQLEARKHYASNQK